MGTNDHRGSRRTALLAIALFLFLTSIIGALAMSITAPQSVTEGEPLTVTMSGSGQLTIARNGVFAVGGTGTVSDTLQTDSGSAGLYTYTFSDDTGSETRTIEVIDVPLIITPTAPSSDLASTSAEFSLTTSIPPEFCYVTIDGASHTLQASSPTEFSGTFPIGDGVHTVDYKCKLGSEIVQVSRSIHVDSAPPVITAASPAGDVGGPYVTLSVDTDEISVCRYGTADAPFASLPSSMGDSYVLRNTATVRIDTYGSYTYFVRCKDVNGNAMASSQIISFLAKVPPRARVAIDESQPLRAGTYTVQLTTDVPLSATPSLFYTFQESGKRQQVALTGDGDSWTGHVTVDPNMEDTVMAFSFSGTNIQGVSGTEITQGSLFTIDAKAPPAVDSISVENDSKRIIVKWYSVDDEDHAGYNIYRSGNEGVAYTDFYATTAQHEYVDYAATGSRYYYYRVAPIDAAGNIGPLSAEVYGSVIDNVVQQSAPAADPLALARIDEEIAAIQGVMLDANATIKTLSEESNPAVIGIIKDMRLLEDARAAALKLEASVTALRQLQQRSPSTDETDTAIAQSRKSVEEARKLLVRRIMPQQQTETTQTVNDQGVRRYAPYALIGVNLSASGRESFISDARALQDRATVSVSASTFTITDLAGETIDYTFVRKRITLQDPANGITLLEVIPKEFADDASMVSFSKTPVVLERDPVVQYSYGVLQQEEYSYYVKRIVPLDEVKSSLTLLYPTPSAPQEGAKGSADGANTGGGGIGGITGNVVSVLPSSGDGVLIAIGVIIIIALGAYYVSLEPHAPRAAKGFPVTAAAVVSRPLPQRTVRAPVRVTRAAMPSKVQDAPRDAVPPARRTSEDIKGLLHDACSLIDGKEYDRALGAYREAVAALQDDPGLEQMLHDEVTRTYAKLLLFKQLSRAKAAADAGDHAVLRDALSQVRSLAAQVGEENTVLITEAKASYADFVRKLNALEIARAGKY